MLLIVAGSRCVDTGELAQIRLHAHLRILGWDQPKLVLCGMARGADTLGKLWAESMGYQVEEFPADWARFGQRAGYLRNEAMAIRGTHLLAVWDGSSPGTRHMINLARRHQLEVQIRRWDP